MKRILCLAAVAIGLSSCGVVSQLDAGRLLEGGVYAAQALTLTDAQVEQYVHQYITQLDAQSQVLPESNAYTKRLRKIINSMDGVNEMPLNFKVYKENEVTDEKVYILVDFPHYYCRSCWIFRMDPGTGEQSSPGIFHNHRL